MRDPLTVAIDEACTVPQTMQRYYLLQESSKVAALTLLLEAEEIKSALILPAPGSGRLSWLRPWWPGAIRQKPYMVISARPPVRPCCGRFRNGRVTLLVATDVGRAGSTLRRCRTS